MKRIGLLGGTFNPIHHGHLFLAAAAEHRFALQEVWFVPNRFPPHKPAPEVDDAQRVALLELALADRPHWTVSRVELDHQGTSYTVDTLGRMPEGHEYFFLTGTDALFVPWRDLDGVLARLERLVVATRPGHSFEELQRHLAGLGVKEPEKVVHLDMPPLAISSSELRKRLAEGQPVDYLVPKEVLSEIDRRGLYQGSQPSGGGTIKIT